MNINNPLYFYLFLFFIFVLVHKLVAMIILFNISIVNFRYYLNIFEPIFILSFYLLFKLNTQLKVTLGIFLLAPINYWLCDQGLIYKFIDKTPQNNNIVKNVKNYGDILINIFVFSYIAYFLYALML